MEKIIYILIFILPAYLLRVEFFGIPTNVFEVLAGVFLAMVVVRKKITMLKAKEIFFDNKKIILAITVMLVGLLFSMIINENYAKGLGIIKSWFLIPLAFAGAAAILLNKDKIQKVYWAYFYSAAAVAVVALGYFISGKLTFDGRLEAFFNSPNYLAMYLAPALITGYFFFKSQKYNFRNEILNKQRLIGSLFLLITVAFYLTYSYAAWTAFIAGIFLAEVLCAKNKVLNFRNILIAGVVILAIISSQWQNKKLQDWISLDERSSLASRVMIWRSAEKILADNWFWGISPGNFQAKYLEYQKYFSPYLEWSVPHPHNLFLAFWLSGGLLGLLGFGALIFWWLRQMFGKAPQSTTRLVALGIMLYVLIHGLADTTYFKNDLAVVFWLNFFFGLKLLEEND